MPKKGQKAGNSTEGSGRRQREERLAAALRDNLKRRKAQARGRSEAKTGSGRESDGRGGDEGSGKR